MSRRPSSRRDILVRGGQLARRLKASAGRRVRSLETLRARAAWASVLDGTTLRVSGRVQPGLASASGGAPLELWLRRRGGDAVPLCAVELGERSRMGTTFEAACSLATARAGGPLGPGNWDVYLRVPGHRRLLPVRAAKPDRDVGPTLANPRSPETGLWYRLRTSPIGQLWVQVKAFPPHAEVEHVRSELTALVVEGRIVGATPHVPADPASGPPPVLAFREQGTDTVHPVPARLIEGRFRAEVDPELFAGRDGEPRRWEVTLRVPGSEPMVVGRFLDDMRDPESVYRYPRVVVGSGTGRPVALQLGYTGERRLVLDAAPAVGEAAGS